MCTMLAKKEIPVSVSVQAWRKELEHLYARREAIDTLIESLEEYDRCRVDLAGKSRLQTA